MAYIKETQFRAPIPHYVPDHTWMAQSPWQANPLDGADGLGMDETVKNMLTYGAIALGGLLLLRHVLFKPARRKNPRRRRNRSARLPRTRIGKRSRGRKRSGGKWIAGAIKRPGAFRSYMKRRYGDRAFTGRGTLKMSYINRVIADPKVSPRVHKQAVLARTLKRI